MNGYAPLEPSLLLLSTLGSLPFAVYCVRFVGMAALHVKRDARRRISGVWLDGRWTDLLTKLLVASMIASAAAWSVGAIDGAFAAVLVGSLWPHADHGTSRALLLTYLAAIALAIVATSTAAVAAVMAALLIGFASVLFAAYLLRPRP